MAFERERELERRVLLLAPTRRDTDITIGFLRQGGLSCVGFDDLRALARETVEGCGALLLTEEAVTAPGIEELIAALEAQPAWSDIPVVMLMRGGIQSPESARVLHLLRNVMLLERPAPTRSVVSAAQAAVRARQRQYEAREQIGIIGRAQARYRELQQQLEIAIEASELGTFHCEMPLGRIVWNNRCKAHFWLPPDAQITFELFYSILHPDDRERTRQAVEACVFRGGPYDIEYRTVSPKGEIRWIRATGRTLVDEHGQPMQFDGTTKDITAIKAAAEEREQLLRSEQAARAESERAGRMKDEFLATLSHELRTPLNAILGWSQLLVRGEDEETLKEGLEVIERNAKAQAQIIEDLLDMSRIISGKLHLDVQPIDPATFINAAIETVMPSAKAREIRLRKTLDPKAGSISGDANRLHQVVWNLLSNAIKFTPRGGGVDISLKRVNAHIEIAVTDTGEGIEPQFLPHVFERFRQANASSTRSHGGLGLGLAIAKQLVELHGGTITAASEGAGRGSSFTVSLPTVLSGPTYEPEAPAPRRETKLNGLDCKETALEGMTVLVVDDEPDARTLLKRVLEECGATVSAAGSAAEAIEIVPSLRPNVLVSDIGMPQMDGYELLKRIRALGSPRGGDVPAIALTAFARSEDRTRALLAGYLVHIAKPVEPHELVKSVATVAGRGPGQGA